jgi:hypothetical protein
MVAVSQEQRPSSPFTVTTDIPFDQAIDNNVEYYDDEEEPGKIRVNRRSPQNTQPQHQRSQASQSPTWSRNSPTRGNRTISRTRGSPGDVQYGGNSPTIPFDENSQAVQESPHSYAFEQAYDEDESPHNRIWYRMTPPRVSGPLSKPYVDDEAIDYCDEENSTSALTGEFSIERPAAQRPQQPEVSARNLKTSNAREHPPNATIVMPRVDPYNPNTIYGKKPAQQVVVKSAEDDDSLFDFVDNKNEKDRINSKQQQKLGHYSSEEDAPTTLQQRAQAAWKRKKALQQQQQLQQQTLVPVAASTTNTTATTPMVSFGKDDVVHNYDPHQNQNEISADVDTTTLDSTTLGGRSINSLYTKSAESEVEDLIKDIFMIGSGEATNPGRRKIKHNPRVQEKLQRRIDEEYDDYEEETSYDDTTTHDDTDTTGRNEDTTTYETTTYESTTYDGGPNASRDVSSLTTPATTKKKKTPPGPVVENEKVLADEKKEDDPLTEAWNFVGGQLNAMGAALGLDGGKGINNSNKRGNKNEGGSVSPRSNEGANTPSRNFLDIVSDVLLGPQDAICQVQANKSSEPDTGIYTIETSPSLEEDIRLVDLAIQAAMSMHRLNGYEFDTSVEIDIANEIKFSVVDLTLPLGLIFQENEKGCWVTKVLSGGSAHAAGNVHVGDQLAAIDGVSAINMTVDEIASMIRQKNRSTELTFIRYVGPLKPEPGSVIQEEGYEIHATQQKGLKKRLSMTRRQDPPSISHSSPSPKAPVKGILKTKSVEPESPTNKKIAVSEQRKRFRLFGRRKQTPQ